MQKITPLPRPLGGAGKRAGGLRFSGPRRPRNELYFLHWAFAAQADNWPYIAPIINLAVLLRLVNPREALLNPLCRHKPFILPIALNPICGKWTVFL